jgi:protein SCO1/2
MTTRRHLMLATAGAVAMPILLAACEPRQGGAPAGSFKAVDITGAEYAKDFALPDTEGRTRTLADFKGRMVVVFFGFTQCPDVCPTTMTELAAVKKALGADGDKLQPVFISIDPERDTPAILKAYMASFDPSFVALRGTLEETAATAKGFKVFYQKVPGKTDGSYTMDHTAGAYVFDPEGRVRLFVRYGQPVADWVSDLKQLLA